MIDLLYSGPSVMRHARAFDSFPSSLVALLEQPLVFGPQPVHFLFNGAPVAPAREGLRTLGGEQLLPGADLGVAEAELPYNS